MFKASHLSHWITSYTKKQNVGSLSTENASATGCLDLGLGFLGEVFSLNDDGLLRQVTASQELVESLRTEDDERKKVSKVWRTCRRLIMKIKLDQV